MDDIAVQKRNLEKSIVEAVIAALKNNTLLEDELSLISEFVLSNIDGIKNDYELQVFTDTLVKRWPQLVHLKTEVTGFLKEKTENEVAEGVLLLTKHGKIEEALKLAKSITQ